MEEKTIVTPGLSESLWRFLASLKLTVVLLLCLAVLSVIGTVIPQNAAQQVYIDQYGLFAYRLFILFDIQDMYHSWWFVGLLVLLVINIVVCSVDRLQHTAGIIFNRHPTFDLQRYRKRKNRQDFSINTSAENLKEPFRRFVAKRFRFCKVVATEKGFAVTAEKGRWTRLGVYIVHLSVVVLLFGGLLGAKFGFEGFVAIPEGETANTVRLNRSGQPFTLPFAIRCDDFDLKFYEGTQRPREYRSSLTILQDGREILNKSIVVNDPLYYKGIGIFQSSYGRLEDDAVSAIPDFEPSEPLELTFRSVDSGMVYTRTVKMDQPVQLPEGLGTFVLERYTKDAEFRGMHLGPALTGTLTKAGGEAQVVTLPFKYPKFDGMRGGDVHVALAAPQLREAVEQRFYTGLQVAYDPGVGVVYAGFVLMILGCAVTFFMSHQQVVVEVVEEKRVSAVRIAGTSNKNKVGFQLKLKRLSEQLSEIAHEGTR